LDTVIFIVARSLLTRGCSTRLGSRLADGVIETSSDRIDLIVAKLTKERGRLVVLENR